MKFSFLSSLSIVAASLSLPGGIAAASSRSDGLLTEPSELSSPDGGDLEIDLNIAAGSHTTAAVTQFKTRLLGGTLPGPTVRIRKGQTLIVNFKNELVSQGGNKYNKTPLTFNRPDNTNLHFHGAYVSSERPADDTTLDLKPGDKFRYEVNFPSNHMGGIHWIHPHRHGSGTFQVGGGAAMALIVEDDPGEVPQEVATATEVVMMVQLFNKDDMDEIAVESMNNGNIDSVFNLQPEIDVGNEFLLINGQYQPDLRLAVGAWYRLRVVYASWDKLSLDLDIGTGGNCEAYLLAKDGIYISDYPRSLDVFPIPSGGRADIMLRCDTAGSYDIGTFLSDEDEEEEKQKRLFKINAIEVSDSEDKPNTPLSEGFFGEQDDRPSYQDNLLGSEVLPQCNCTTKMGSGDKMNYLSFDKNLYIHTVGTNNVVERLIDGVDSHPYHQHIYPFQLINVNLNDPVRAAYYKVGDYHDSYFAGSPRGLDSDDEFSDPDTATIRYNPKSFTGRMPVHCHRLDHSDKGMLAAENVVKNGECDCAASFPFISPPKKKQSNDTPLEWKIGQKKTVYSCDSDCSEPKVEKLCPETCGKTNTKCKDENKKVKFFLDNGDKVTCKTVSKGDNDNKYCADPKVAITCPKACGLCAGNKPKPPTKAPSDDDY